MTAKELKQKYLEFFEKNGHTIIAGAPLVPENDPTALFTTAGMHPLVPYLLGEKHPAGTRLTDVQKCIRTGDIDEVGDNWHLTFFEMLGNWSLGDYGKKEAIEFSFNFLTKELEISLDKLAVTVFTGEEGIPRDEESAETWKSLGVKPERIAYLGREDNWWGPAGQTGPCGPDTEMFYWSSEEDAPEVYDPKDKRWVEIWNDVFMIYNKKVDGTYEPLAQKNVDTGMGVERTVATLAGKSSAYDVDPLFSITVQVCALFNTTPEELEFENIKPVRIIADHLRATTFILADGVTPSNVEQGYVLRRLIRRAIRYGSELGITSPFTQQVAEAVIDLQGGFYKELREKRDFIMEELAKEEEKFNATLENGLKKFEKLKVEGSKVSGKDVFILFSTYGFPVEITRDLAKENGWTIDEEEFAKEFAQHQDLSRKGAEQKFKGGLADNSEVTTRMHTATHLMIAALRKVLGEHVYQKGANITAERIRFDFSHPEKMTPEQIKQVEDLVNEQIEKAHPVSCEELTLEEAKERGAMGVFESKYGEKVKVYTVGGDSQVKDAFSKEICGGPHVQNTLELGHFKILKEESSSSGVRRIKAILE
ncbi:MAG: Alanine--tRNA ligase [Parcubacteria group bacterium ADurb.Bin326]|nr:MAG: Alanine--tRNA ligase [Parcubacteria group bacterium ADurb.Bin326]